VSKLAAFRRDRSLGAKISGGRDHTPANILIPLERQLIALSGGVGQFERRFQGEVVVPGEYFLVSTKLHTFCYPTVQTAPCYVPSF